MKVTYNSDMTGGGQTHRQPHRFIAGLLAIVIGGVGLTPFLGHTVHAQQLIDRSLRISSATVGATTAHTFKFSYATTTVPVGSLAFEYCTSPLADLPCDAPAGVNASNAVLSSQTGEGGYFVLVRQTGRIILTRAPSLPPTINPSQYIFDTIVNPTGSPGTFYVRISTYNSTDGSGSPIDFGAVANSTTQGVAVSS